jgi:hypothetical protein
METYLTVRELAGKVQLTEQTIYRYVMKKAIPFHKINRAEREAAGLAVPNGGKAESKQGKINFTPEFEGL